MRTTWQVTGGILLTLLAACGGQQEAPSGATPAAPAATEAATTGTDLTPDPGGQVITVQMMTDEQGNNRFEPADFDAKPGDVIRYTLVSGVHNAAFPADSNASTSALPPAGPMLQLPQQTYDVKVTMGPGRHYFQCDPHALLGMVGHVTVKQ